MSTSNVFLSGMATMGFILSGLFFFRFWRRTTDRLFLTFGIAFWLLALNQSAIVLSNFPREEQGWVYMPKLLAFALIIVAIVFKTVGGDRSDAK